MVAECRHSVDGVNNVARKVAGMAGHEANAPDAWYLAHGCQQFREAALPFRVAVAVHILAQKLDLGVSKIGDAPRLHQHRRRRPAALHATRVRYHAVGTELIAALDDGDVSR